MRRGFVFGRNVGGSGAVEGQSVRRGFYTLDL